MRLYPLLFLAGLLPAAAAAPLTARQSHDLRCAAAFALVAGAQQRGEAEALKLPPLALRGRRYFSAVGERIADEAGLDQAAMRAMLTDQAKSVAAAGVLGVARACLGDLDAVIPPHPAPDAPGCHALLAVYAEVLAARGGADPLTAELSAEAAALAPRAAPAGAAAIAAAKARVREALTRGTGAIDADDVKACRAMARATHAPG